MGILETVLKSKQKQKKDLGVCIPNHAKSKYDLEETHAEQEKKSNCETQKQSFSDPASFVVEGIYEIKKTMMINGEVCFGAISKESKLKYRGDEIPVGEILVQGRQVSELKENEKGTITICPEGYVRIALNDLLEFE